MRRRLSPLALADSSWERFHDDSLKLRIAHDAFIPTCPAARHPCRLLHSRIRHRRVGADGALCQGQGRADRCQPWCSAAVPGAGFVAGDAAGGCADWAAGLPPGDGDHLRDDAVRPALAGAGALAGGAGRGAVRVRRRRRCTGLCDEHAGGRGRARRRARNDVRLPRLLQHRWLRRRRLHDRPADSGHAAVAGRAGLSGSTAAGCGSVGAALAPTTDPA